MRGLYPVDSDEPFIELRRLTKRFGAFAALKGVSLNVHRGEVVGIIGANGAGKSTLMRLLTGGETPDEGQILIDGEVTTFPTPRHALNAGIVRVAQEIELVEDESVAVNLMLGRLPARAGWVRHRALLAAARDALAEVGLRLDPRCDARSLTSVEQRLVTIARALAARPRVLVLDEPTAALPTETAVRLRPIIARLAESGTAVLYVSHRLEEIRSICSRVIAMRDGAVAGVLAGGAIEIAKMVEMVGGSALSEEPQPSRRAVTTEPAIRLSKLSGSRVNDVDLTVSRGEVVGIGGLQGAGRSELLRLMAGAQRPTAGHVEMLGDPAPSSPRQAAARGIGYLTERRTEMLFPGMSAIENASISSLERFTSGGTLVRRRREEQAVTAVIDRVRLRGDRNAPVDVLSGGNKQKVCLARWLMRECSILLLDEPTVGVDVHARAEIHRLLRDLAQEGVTIVLASAEPEELVLVSDRVVVLVEGRVGAELVSPLDTAAVVTASYSPASVRA